MVLRVKRGLTWERKSRSHVTTALQQAERESPVIHPGDEAPFLVWGGQGSALRAAMRRLTEAGKPAMLGIDVPAQDKA